MSRFSNQYISVQEDPHQLNNTMDSKANCASAYSYSEEEKCIFVARRNFLRLFARI